MNRRILMYFSTALLLFMVHAGAAAGADEQKHAGSAEAHGKKAADKKLFLNYTPPRTGKPGGRVGGGTRGVEIQDFVLVALVPDHVGLSATSEPSLCWYVSRPTDLTIEITVNHEKSVKPVLEKQLTRPDRAGIYCVSAASLGLRLEASVEYEWFIAAVPDPEQRSKDIASGGGIMFKEPSREVQSEVKDASGIGVTEVYARRGYWYDALSSLSELIQRNPQDRLLAEQRVLLLEQAGLNNYMK